MDRTDEQLARASIQRDPEAFGVLIERVRCPLIAYIAGLRATRDDAEELAQETFLVAWQKLPSLRDPARVKGWIYRIAHNLAARPAKSVRTVPLAGDPPVPSGDCHRSQRLIGLLAAVARLSEPQREVIARKHFAGETGDQIARRLAIPPGTVRSRLSRAYTELREMLTKQEAL